MQPPETAEQRGLALIDARRYREAVKVLRPAVDKTPGDPWLRCALAQALVHLDRGREALDHALAAQQINQYSPRIEQMVAEAHLELGHHEEAMKAVDRLLDLSPNEAIGYDLRGRIALARRKFEDAEVNFREALRLKPNSWAYNNNLGVALRNQGRDKAALEYLERAVRANPSSRLVRRNLFGAISGYQTAAVFIAIVVVLRVVATNAKTFHLPPVVAEVAFFIGVIAAAVGAVLWARRQRRRLSPLVNRIYDEDWWRQRGLYVLRYLFRFVPVMLVVVAVAVLGFNEHVGYLPWIVAGGILVIAWWFAWRPAWRRVVAIFDRQ